MTSLRLYTFALLGSLAFAADMNDLVPDLPGLDSSSINFNHYSGYLNATEGRFLHYWFIESQNNPPDDPLMLWLNGGPGCSSLLGLTTELGPFYVMPDLSIGIMEYSWNQIANIIFLESPACVGFSYDEGGSCASSDSSTSLQNYLAVQHFFEKFPEYMNNPFYIVGESYAGQYIPSLAMQIVEGKDDFYPNFVGYGIGNGLLDYSSNDDSLVYYAYYHGLVDETLWANLISNCCENGLEDRDSCAFADPPNSVCNTFVNNVFDIVYDSGLNIYSLYADCRSSNSSTGVSKMNIESQNLFRNIKSKTVRPEARSDPPCLEYDLERAYLNSPQVKEALHISPLASDWDVCTTLLYLRETENTTIFLPSLAAEGLRALVYSGDTDMAVNFMGNQWDLESLQFPVEAEQRTWIVDGQVAGFVKQFTLIDFVTVKGSGHMVPEDKPKEGFEMIKSFLNGDPY